MCGIVGLLNGEARTSVNKDYNNYMATGCLWGMVRGMDSTGLMQMDKKNNVKVLKSVVDGYNFLLRKQTQTALNNVDDSLATIIHHRAATHGSVAYDNCHPFEHEVGDRWVCGVHNGTIGGYNRKEDGIEFDVDSDWLYYRIAKLGAAEALGDLTHGAYALVWAEKPSNKILIAANSERPIHWAFVHKKNVMLIASEGEMLFSMASRHGLKIDKVMYPDTNHFYEFDVNGDLRDFKKQKLKEKKWDWNKHNTHSAVRNDVYVRDPLSIDSYTAPDIEQLNLTRNEEVEFVMKETSELASPNYSKVVGEILTTSGNVLPAVMPSCGMIAIDNMRDARTILCRVIGVNTKKNDRGEVVGRSVILATPHSIVKDDVAGIETVPDVRGPASRMIPVHKYLKLTKDGCSNCRRDITIPMADTLSWHENSPICSDCSIELAYGDYYANHGQALN